MEHQSRVTPDTNGGKCNKRLMRDLREAGLSQDRIDQIVGVRTNSPELSAREYGIVANSLGKAVAAFQDEHLKNMFVMPDAAMFFEVRNEGSRAAKNAHLVVRIEGEIYEALFDSDNKWASSAGDQGQKIYEIDTLAPKSRTKGIIWYSHVFSKTPIYTNEVTLTCDSGTTTRAFTEGNFIWGK